MACCLICLVTSSSVFLTAPRSHANPKHAHVQTSHAHCGCHQFFETVALLKSGFLNVRVWLNMHCEDLRSLYDGVAEATKDGTRAHCWILPHLASSPTLVGSHVCQTQKSKMHRSLRCPKYVGQSFRTEACATHCACKWEHDLQA